MRYLLPDFNILTWMAIGASVVAAVAFVAMPDLGLIILLDSLLMTHLFLRQRGTAFQASLPISAKSIVFAKLSLAIAMVLLPMLVWIAMGLFNFDGFLNIAFVNIPVRMRVVAAEVVVLAILLTGLVKRGDLNSPSLTALYLPWGILGAVTTAAVYLLPSTVVQVMLAAAIPLLVYAVWRVTPETFHLAPASARISINLPLSRAGFSGAPSMQSWRWVLFRTILLNPFSTMAVLSMVFLAAMGHAGIALFGIFLGSDVVMRRLQTKWMHVLPLSQRKLLVMTVVAPILVYVAILLVTRMVLFAIPGMETMNQLAPHSYSRSHKFIEHTKVALTFWERSPDGEAQVIQAPWGETSPADTLRVLGVTFFNPYSALRTNSREFAEWQFSRASVAVYGRSLSLASYEADELKMPARITRSAPMYILFAGLLVTYALLVAMLWELARWRGMARLRSPNLAGGMLAMLPLTMFMFFEIYYSFRHRTGITIPLAESAFLRLTELLPSGLLPVIVVAAIPPTIVLLLLEKLFKKSEYADKIVRLK